MDNHAIAAYPRECCGLLLGTKQGTIIEAVPTENTIRKSHAHHAFAIPLITVLIIRRMVRKLVKHDPRLKNLRMLGFYHSHPNARPIPSKDDIALAWPRHVYLIARTQRGTVCPWHAWVLDDETPAELPMTTEGDIPA
jgi:proteasome lid subunit RPN8/RPN11